MSLDGVASRTDILLYAIHSTDYKDNRQGACFRTELNQIPQNILWYSGSRASIIGEWPGHIYKHNVAHGIGNNDPFFQAIESLVKKIKGKPGIEESDWDALYSEKDCLVALSILCQGYLAAHGGDGLKGWGSLSEDLKKTAVSKKEGTEDKTWWVLKEDFIGRVKAQLDNVNEKTEGKGEIKKMIAMMEDSALSVISDTNTVKAAYEAISKVL